LRRRGRSALVSDRTGLIENTSTARHPHAWIRDEQNEPDRETWWDLFVAGELAVAYCCGQTGGNSVIAPEITEVFFVHPLWTGVFDV